MDLDNWDHTFDDGWFDIVRFFDLPHIWCHTGAYSVSVEIHRFSWICMITPIYEMHAKTMTYLLSYHDPLVQSLLSHPVMPTLFSIQMSSCFLLGDALLTLRFDSIMDVDDQDYTFDDGWFDVIWFSNLSYIWCYTRAYSVSVQIYRSLRSCMITPTY